MNTHSSEPVAIVGMSGRFPGAADIDALWELLNAGGTAIVPVPPQRWDAHAPLDRDKRIQAVGGFLEGVDLFDAAFFGISPREAADIDPQQRLMLEMTWRALEDGRVPTGSLRGSRTGVYIGASWHDYQILRKELGLGASQHSAVGTALDIIAARVSYFLGLTGPSLTVETGCSSALVGLDLAVRAIRSGDIDSAVVGGVNLILAPDVSIGLTHFGGLSERGRCAAFGADADGFVRGEGVVALYLKPLSAALRDGDRVRAVIEHTVVNNDGGGRSLVTPSLDGQRDLLRRAYPPGTLDPGRLAYLEAHGTGTRRGDPIEARALGEILGASRDPAAPLPIGSIKTNIGHLEAAAGIAGLVKAVLCLEHGRIPPTLHADPPNPEIPFDTLNLRIVQEHTAFETGPDALVGVNSFGWGGTNAHVVLRGADVPLTPVAAVPDSVATVGTEPGTGGFVAVSGHSAEALRQRCRDIADLVDSAPERLDEVRAALVRRGPDLALRVAVLGTDAGEVAGALRGYADDPGGETAGVVSGRAREGGRTAFVFPGQGSQWHGLGAALYGRDPAFTGAVDACATALRPYVDWDPVAVVSGAAGPGWLDRVDQVQPVLWVLSLGIAVMWRRAGIVPDVVVGHSQGEIAAATVAGLLDIDDAALIVARRSALLRSVAGTGRMLAVELPVDEIPGAIAGFEDDVALAVHNGPTSCVLSGDADAIEALAEILGADGVFCRMVTVDYASHSPGMAALRPPLLAELGGVTPRPGAIEMMSTVLVRPVAARDLGGDYWVENLCEPVLFADAMTAVFEAGVTHVIEISPHPVLLPAVEQLAAERAVPPVALPSCHRDRDPVAEMTRSRARAFVAGLRPGAGTTVGSGITLPPYPLAGQSHWFAEGASAATPATDPLRVPLYPSVIDATAWQATVTLDRNALPWLADHRVGEAVVTPGAMLAALAIATTGTHLGTRPVALSGVRFIEKLVLGTAPARAEVTLRQDFSAGVSFEIASLTVDTGGWTVHARGRALHTLDRPTSPRPYPAADPEPTEIIDPADFYAACARRGLDYGPDFRGVRSLRRLRTDEEQVALAEIALSDRARAQSHPGELHPVLLDCAMQTALTLFDGETTVLPAGIAELVLDAEPSGFIDAARVLAIRRSDTTADIHLYAPNHEPLARLLGLELVEIAPDPTQTRPYDREFTLTLRPTPRPAPDTPAEVFAVTGSAPQAAVLSAALRRTGARIVSAPTTAGTAPVGAETRHVSEPVGAVGGDLGVPGRAAAEAATEPGITVAGVAPGTGATAAVAVAATASVAETYSAGADSGGIAGSTASGPAAATATENPGTAVVVARAATDVPAAASAAMADGALASAGTVVYLAPAEQQGLSAQRRGLADLADLVRACVRTTSTPPRLVVVTTGAQAADAGDRPDPGGALYWGFVRVLRREHPELSAELIDLAPERDLEPRFDDCAAELLARTGADQVVLRPDQRFVAHLERGERPEPAVAARPWRTPAQPFRLARTAGGFWDGLRYRPLDVRQPGAGEVLIEIDAAALNFIDAMKAAGTYPDDSAAPDLLGLECAGVIRAVGPEVTGRAVGDRVVGCGFGAIASHLTVRADHTRPIPAGMATEIAAAQPMVTTTAWYALVTLARLAPGETVLIHSGTGGLGLAAIGVARGIGARIIATAGTPERRAYLRRELGLEHVFDSRDLSWADRVREVTGPHGVDVLLNSLTGAAIDLGMALLAEDGRFIEVGKKDIYAGRRIGLHAFAKGITFAAVDLTGLMARRPERFAAVFGAAWDRISSGALAPLPVTAYVFADAAAVLARMTRGAHIGKLVLTAPETVAEIAPEPLPDGRFRAHGTYVITGGHGALGRSLAVHLRAAGAGAVALIGRNAPDTTGEPGIHSYRADVSDGESLAAALDCIRAELPPVRGIFHAAGILDDATILGLRPDQLERVLRPKIDGARHLDALTASDPLDLFVLFSSAAALIGNPGQAAYAAANAYLDALARARRHAGQPGLSVQWGPFAEIGLAAAQENRGARLAEQGMGGFGADAAWAALTAFLTEDRDVVGYLSFDARQWFDAHPDAAAQASWQGLRASAREGRPGRTGGEFQAAWSAATGDDRQILVRDKIVEVAARVLRMPTAELDASTPFKALGLDSLMSLELRNRLESAFVLRLSPTLLWTYGTTETLAGAIGERLDRALSEVEAGTA
ncbi:type I polyketide synthase [Nocardia sp. NPDC055321]